MVSDFFQVEWSVSMAYEGILSCGVSPLFRSEQQARDWCEKFPERDDTISVDWTIFRPVIGDGSEDPEHEIVARLEFVGDYYWIETISDMLLQS